MTTTQSSSAKIAVNIRAHDRVAKKYERIHGEIYNPVEQTRLRNALSAALGFVDTIGHTKVVLDFGCGAGNLTSHITDLGCNVIASDVSKGCLDLVLSREYPTKVEAIQLNGIDLSNIVDASVDMVATYSVLHHVPDYFAILSEFIRVLRPGGVIFIDHELSEEVWSPTSERKNFLREMGEVLGWKWRKYLKFENYVNWFIWKFVNPKYRSEGDIHVFKDDHIEWDNIAKTLIAQGAEIVLNERYLLFKRGYDYGIYRKYESKTNDMQFMIARKI